MQNRGSGGGCAFRTAAYQSGGANIFEVYNRVLIWGLDMYRARGLTHRIHNKRICDYGDNNGTIAFVRSCVRAFGDVDLKYVCSTKFVCKMRFEMRTSSVAINFIWNEIDHTIENAKSGFWRWMRISNRCLPIRRCKHI